jgi:hypothetical protein
MTTLGALLAAFLQVEMKAVVELGFAAEIRFTWGYSEMTHGKYPSKAVKRERLATCLIKLRGLRDSKRLIT